MTEPHGGADPTVFAARAMKDGDEWVINGGKFFSSNASTTSFLIVMAVTDPEASPYRGMSMFMVPTNARGLERIFGVGGEPPSGGHHPSSATRTCGYRLTPCSAAKDRRSRSRRPG